MPVGIQLYDQEHEAPAPRGNVVDLWGADEDWDFPMLGALALQPEPVEPSGCAAQSQPETWRFRLSARVTVRYRAADGYDGSPWLRRAREAAPA